MDTEKKLAEALRQSIAALSMASLYVDGEAGADESAQVSEAVANARAALAEYDAAAREPIRLVVQLEGGLVHWIGTDSALPIEVAVIDYDSDGADDDEVAEIPQDDGGTAEAVARIETADASDPAWVARAFAAIRENEP